MTVQGTDIVNTRPKHRVLDRVHVLVVEDDPDSRTMIARAIRCAGARVMDVASATDALRVLSFVRPDILVSDIAMPGMDGYELLRRVRRLAAPAGGVIPAIAVTAFSSHEDRRRAFEAGFDELLAKPLQLGPLVTTIRNVLCVAHRMT